MIFIVKDFDVVDNYKLLWLLRKVDDRFNTLIFDTPLLNWTPRAENIVWAVFASDMIWQLLQNLNTITGE
jgi:hypothetical protein